MGYSGFLVNLKDNGVRLPLSSGCEQLHLYIRKKRSRSIMLTIVAQTDRFILKHKRYEREAGCSRWEPLRLLQRHRTVRVREEQLQKLPHFTLDLSVIDEFVETDADFLPRRSHFNQRTRGQDLGVHTGRFASDWRRCWILDYIRARWPATTTIRCWRCLQLDY